MLLLALTLPASARDAPRFEAELLQGLRDQTVSAEIAPDLIGVRRHLGITTGVRLRAETEDSRWGVEIAGAGDWLTLSKGERPERYGGARALVGVRKRSPLTESVGHLRVGLVARDLQTLADPFHTPHHMWTAGLEGRRITSTNIQEVQLDGMIGERAMGGLLRGRIGVLLEEGWFALLGGSTDRFWDIPGSRGSELRQTTYQAEVSLMFQAKRPASER